MTKKSLKRISRLTVLIVSVAALILTTTILADTDPSEETAAANYLVENGILQGGDNGDLMLDRGLRRGELATLLYRLNGGAETDAAKAPYVKMVQDGKLGFTDTENHWSSAYVMYCKENGLVNGISATMFAPDDMVDAKMVCTVVLRWLGYKDIADSMDNPVSTTRAEDEWSYGTSLSKAKLIGIAPDVLEYELMGIRRGDMAVIIYRAMRKNAGEDIQPDVPPIPDYSQEANPEIFESGRFTREAYNILYDAMIRQQEWIKINQEEWIKETLGF